MFVDELLTVIPAYLEYEKHTKEENVKKLRDFQCVCVPGSILGTRDMSPILPELSPVLLNICYAKFSGFSCKLAEKSSHCDYYMVC